MSIVGSCRRVFGARLLPFATSGLLTLLGATHVSGQTSNATVAGAVTTPSPTIHNATLEWAITGDANNNGVVSVRYRRIVDSTWKTGMPLRRIPAGTLEGFSWTNRHSGSLFDLDAATTYEVELS